MGSFFFDRANKIIRIELAPLLKRPREICVRALFNTGLWKPSSRKLHLASGPTLLSGWMNIDLWQKGAVCLDVRGGLPFSDNSFDCIYSSHFFEHLGPAQEFPEVLKECHRVLAPGGVLRCVVPSLAKAAKQFARAPSESRFDTMVRVVYEHDHKNAFYFPAIKKSLARAGFSCIREIRPHDSAIPGLQQDYHVNDHSLVVECMKSGARPRNASRGHRKHAPFKRRRPKPNRRRPPKTP